LQAASLEPGETTQPVRRGAGGASEARIWLGAQAALSLMLFSTLMWGLEEWRKYNALMPLEPAQRVMGWLLIGAGLVIFGVRSVLLGLRFFAGSGPR
jgi:hypothetical protein